MILGEAVTALRTSTGWQKAFLFGPRSSPSTATYYTRWILAQLHPLYGIHFLKVAGYLTRKLRVSLRVRIFSASRKVQLQVDYQ